MWREGGTRLHGHGQVAVGFCGSTVVPGTGSVVELGHRAQGLRRVLWVARLQVLVGHVVGLAELGEVAAHLRVSDLQRGRVGLQVLWTETGTTRWSIQMDLTVGAGGGGKGSCL